MGKKLTTSEFIEKAKLVHGDKYDYTKTEYINKRSLVCIICPIHGEFNQNSGTHMKGCGCPKCSSKHNKTTEEFITEANIIHQNKYIYTNSKYITALDQISIICKEHGEFYQEANTHLRGCGCPKCAGIYMDQESFIEKSKQVHANKYDYTKVIYINSITKVCIICPKHGEFWQSPNKHIQFHGCPRCSESKLEREVRQLLAQNNINFTSQYAPKWLGRQRFDFYLPDYNIAIECQGRQHFESDKFFGGDKGFKNRIRLDTIKYNLCSKNDVKLLYFSNEKNIDFTDYIDKVFTDESELINKIKECLIT